MKENKEKKYWEELLSKEGLDIIGERTDYVKNNFSNLLNSYSLEDIKDFIEIEDEEDKVIFYYDSKLIGVIEFDFISEEEVFLNFSGTINAKEKDFDILPETVYKNYIKYFDFYEEIQIKGLGEYIYTYFIGKLTDLGIKAIKLEIFNEKLITVVENLNEKNIIKSFYTDTNGISIIEL